MGTGNAKIFAIFGDGAARDLNAFFAEAFGDLLVGEWVRGVFVVNHFFNASLERKQRHFAALRPVHGFAEEIAELEDALRRVDIFIGYGAADGGRMHADFFGDFLDHHGLQMIGAVIEEISLAPQDRLADALNGVLALFDIFHQLDGSGETFLDVIADVAVGGITSEQAAIHWVEAELRQVVFVHERLPFAVNFAELNVRLDEARLGVVVTQAGLGIELFDYVHGALD